MAVNYLALVYPCKQPYLGVVCTGRFSFVYQALQQTRNYYQKRIITLLMLLVVGQMDSMNFILSMAITFKSLTWLLHHLLGTVRLFYFDGLVPIPPIKKSDFFFSSDKKRNN